MFESLRPGWFPENTPDIQAIEDEFRQIITSSFKNYWFVRIETPAVERNTVLTAKWWEEVWKQIFWLYWLAQWADDLKPYSLRFDLTVPLARYVLDHEAEIRFPFKRFQIEKVWRWERQQKWRFKEFYQCDVDVIDSNLDLNYDVEIILVLYRALQNIFGKFHISKQSQVHLNNKRFIEMMFDWIEIPADLLPQLYKLFDDYHKLPHDTFVTQLTTLLWEEKSKRLLSIIQIILDQNTETIPAQLKTLLQTEQAASTIDELFFVFNKLREQGVDVQLDPFIMRWLDYYSGTVFETFITGNTDFWSICSWGRYDWLVSSVREKHSVPKGWRKAKEYNWVWWSIGLSRLISRFIDAWYIERGAVPLVDTMIFNIKDESFDYRRQVCEMLRNQWISAEMYFRNDKLAKQFEYAASKRIPLWILAWAKEEMSRSVTIKDLRTENSFEISLETLVGAIRQQLSRIIS